MKTLLVLLALLLQSPAVRTAGDGAVTGQVLTVDGVPAAGVRVAAMEAQAGGENPSAVLLGIVQTDSNGRYRISGIPAGRYYIVAGPVDFLTYYPGAATSAAASSVAIASGAFVEGLDFRLSREAQSGIIQVFVRREDTSQPIGGAQLTITRQNGSAINMRTDGNGHALARDLVPGQYTVAAQAVGTTPSPVSAGVMLTSAQPASHVEFKLMPAATIAGRVLDPGGKPMPGVGIVAMAVRYQEGTRVLAGVGHPQTVTNSFGEYSVSALPAGEYYLAAIYHLESVQQQMYYPGVPGPSAAAAIRVKLGEVTRAADFRLPAPPTNTISGTIVNPYAGRSPNSSTTARDREFTTFSLVPHNATLRLLNAQLLLNEPRDSRGGPDAPFVLRGVFPGDYDLYATFRDPAPGRAESLSSRTPISVRGTNLDNVVIAIRPPAEVRGRVVAEGEIPGIRWDSVRVQFRFKEYLPGAARGGATLNATLIAGDDPASRGFDLTLGAAKYGILVSGLPTGAYMADLRQGGKSLYDDNVLSIGSGPQEPIEIVIRSDGGVIRGSIATAGPAAVVLRPAAPLRKNSALYRRVGVPANGQFTINNVVPGDYELYAFPSLPTGLAEESPEFMAAYEASAHKVTVRPGAETAPVQLALATTASDPNFSAARRDLALVSPGLLPVPAPAIAPATALPLPRPIPAKGMTSLWSVDGRYLDVAGDNEGRTIHALDSQGRLVELDPAGRILRETTISSGPLYGSSLRLQKSSSGELTPVVFGHSSISSYDRNGRVRTSYPGGNSAGDVWAADLDGDRTDEIIIGHIGSGGVDVLDREARLLWKSATIGNVWYVTAGDVLNRGVPQVITTSAAGRVHIFDSKTGEALAEHDPGFYASMVRVGTPSGDRARPLILATGSSDRVVAALSGDGTQRWSTPLSGRAVSGAAAPGKPWFAVGLQGGDVAVLDINTGAMISTVNINATSPRVNWVQTTADGPILLIATGVDLNAFRISPSDTGQQK